MNTFLPRLLIYLNISFLVVVLEILVLGIGAAFFVCLFLFLKQKKKAKQEAKRFQMVEHLLNMIQPGKTLEESLNALLGVFVPLIKAEGYYFYLLNDRKEYVLKAYRDTNTGQSNYQPSYARHAPFHKESYNPLITITQSSAKSTFVQDEEIQLVSIPLKGEQGIIRVGPVSKKTKIDFALLDFLGEKIPPVLEFLIQMDTLKHQGETVINSGKAAKAITDAALNLKGTIDTILGLCMRLVNASGGCFFSLGQKWGNFISVLGLEKELENLLIQDAAAIRSFERLLGHQDIVVLDREEQEFLHVPSYLTPVGTEKIFLVKVPINDEQGIAVFWFNHRLILEQHRIYGLQLVLGRLGDARENYQKNQELSRSYLEVLKVIVNTIDNIDPYMVGFSDLMSRYAGIIAKEMQLADQEVKDVVLAAFLSNIGVIGISTDLLLKEGEYSAIEQETVKLHCDLGASTVEVTLGNSNVASYIRYHHERIDGYGYPSGLKGCEIPLGARIIAVVQFFLVKMMGSKYREPLSFEQVIKQIKEASGSQLDENVVETLINWFRKKQENPLRMGLSLGPCWEMRCSPENICSQCPAYKKVDKNCWEYENVNCLAHGNSCSSCFVYTEFVYRTKM